MCHDKIVCSPHNHPDLPQNGDAQGARINLDEGIRNSFSTAHANLFLSPTPMGDLCVLDRQERYYLRKDDYSHLFVFGRPVNLVYRGLTDAGASCSCHPNGSGFVIHLHGTDYIVPRDQLERVVRAEIPGLVVKPSGSL